MSCNQITQPSVDFSHFLNISSFLSLLLGQTQSGSGLRAGHNHLWLWASDLHQAGSSEATGTTMLVACWLFGICLLLSFWNKFWFGVPMKVRAVIKWPPIFSLPLYHHLLVWAISTGLCTTIYISGEGYEVDCCLSWWWRGAFVWCSGQRPKHA